MALAVFRLVLRIVGSRGILASQSREASSFRGSSSAEGLHILPSTSGAKGSIRRLLKINGRIFVRF